MCRYTKNNQKMTAMTTKMVLPHHRYNKSHRATSFECSSAAGLDHLRMLLPPPFPLSLQTLKEKSHHTNEKSHHQEQEQEQVVVDCCGDVGGRSNVGVGTSTNSNCILSVSEGGQCIVRQVEGECCEGNTCYRDYYACYSPIRPSASVVTKATSTVLTCTAAAMEVRYDTKKNPEDISSPNTLAIARTRTRAKFNAPVAAVTLDGVTTGIKKMTTDTTASSSVMSLVNDEHNNADHCHCQQNHRDEINCMLEDELDVHTCPLLSFSFDDDIVTEESQVCCGIDEVETKKGVHHDSCRSYCIGICACDEDNDDDDDMKLSFLSSKEENVLQSSKMSADEMSSTCTPTLCPSPYVGCYASCCKFPTPPAHKFPTPPPSPPRLERSSNVILYGVIAPIPHKVVPSSSKTTRSIPSQTVRRCRKGCSPLSTTRKHYWSRSTTSSNVRDCYDYWGSSSEERSNHTFCRRRNCLSYPREEHHQLVHDLPQQLRQKRQSSSETTLSSSIVSSSSSSSRQSSASTTSTMTCNVVVEKHQRFLHFIKTMFHFISVDHKDDLLSTLKQIVCHCIEENRTGNPNYTPLQESVVVRVRSISEQYWDQTLFYLGYDCYDIEVYPLLPTQENV